MTTPRFNICLRSRLSAAFVVVVVALLSALPAEVASRAGPDVPETGTAHATAGTVLRLARREILVNKGEDRLEVQRLGFELPPSAEIPECCDGKVTGLLHVSIAHPPPPGQQEYRVNPYSMHPVWNGSSTGGPSSFDLIVKIYPGGGISSYLSSVPVGGLVHAPQIRAADWKSDSKRTAMICFGVGVTGCLDPARELLERGGEVRMIFANRDEEHVIPLPELDALLEEHPEAFALTHYLSRSDGTVTSGAGAPLRTKRGRVDKRALEEEFGPGAWRDGGAAENYLIMGTSEMEMAVLSSLVDVRTLRSHPSFILLKGPYGKNSGWVGLSPGEDDDEEL